jgi:hypothetical protein
MANSILSITIPYFHREVDLREVGDLCPVSREKELEALVRISAHNWCSKLAKYRAPILAFTTQNFGSGKSFFGQNLPQLMRDDLEHHGSVQRSLLGNPMGKVDGLISHKFSIEDLEAFANADVITIDLRRLLSNKSSSLQSLVYQTIFAEATGESISSQGAKDAAQYPGELFDKIRSFNQAQNRRSDGHYVVFFDEIAALEGLKNHSPYVDDINPVLLEAQGKVFQTDENKKNAEIEAIYKVFLHTVWNIMATKNVYIFAAGKSAYLGEHWTSAGNFDSSTSPLSLRMFVLEPFKAEHIEKILVSTKWDSFQPPETPSVRSLVEGFGLLDESTEQPGLSKVEAFCGVILDHTGGIPRYVQATLMELWRRGFSFSTDDDLDRTLTELCEIITTRDASIASSAAYARMSLNDLTIFLNLLQVYLSKGSLSKNCMVRGADGSSRPLMNWIGNCPIFIKQDDKVESHIQFLFCKYLIRALERSPETLKMTAEFKYALQLIVLVYELQKAVDNMGTLKGWISAGRSLELLLANILLGRFFSLPVADASFKTLAGCLDFLANTFLASHTVSSISSVAPFVFLPCITRVNNIMARKEVIEALNANKAGAEDTRLTEFLKVEKQYRDEYNVLQSNIGIPCLPEGENSAGPDILIAVRIGGDDRLAKLMFAAKNFHKKELNFATIEDEVKKAFKYRDFDDGKTAAFRIPGVLVIVSTNIGSEVKSWLHEDFTFTASDSASIGSAEYAAGVTASRPAMKKNWRTLESPSKGSGGGCDRRSSEQGSTVIREFHAKARNIEMLLPEGCQVVVLNQEATEDLLTERISRLLRNLFSSDT